MPKTPKSPRHEELAAEALVNHVLGTRTHSRDDNSQPGMIDALLAAPGQAEPTIALEVTSNLDRKQAELWAALNAKHVSTVHPQLSAGWFVEFTRLATVGGPAQQQLVHFLAALGARGVERVSTREWEAAAPAGSPVPEDVAQIRALGLRTVARIGDGPNVRGRIIPSTLDTGTATATAEAVTPYVDAFLLGNTAANKLGKLQQGKDNGLHTVLFVWADSSHMSIGMALSNAFQPQGQPDVPPHVDELWLASYYAPDTIFRWTRTAGWTVVSSPGVFASVTPSR
ncbi:hypothetical protein AB0D10_00810 [Kitasatospora sp. NPDC048545]|uniref:hypothetical protein n=1 Tax=Kitasatospora sp. NPDC048545 TaxID=3157208 RepID=UPI0033C79A4E